MRTLRVVPIVTVPDLAAGAPILHELGDEAWGVRRFFFADAAGNVVNVLSHLD